MRKESGFTILEQAIVRVPEFGRAQSKLIIAGSCRPLIFLSISDWFSVHIITSAIYLS